MERATIDPRSTTILTISRDYGAGGAEVAEKLARALGWELLDRALLHRAAALEHLPDAELERLDEHEIGLLDRFRLHPPHERYLHGLKEAAQQAAARGKVVFVGRGVRHLLGNANALHLKLVASRGWRAARMARREGWPESESEARVAAVDKTRERFLRYFFGAAAADPAHFDVIANTERMPLDDIVAATLELLGGKPGTSSPLPERRVLTLSRELGAWATEFVPRIARELDLHVYDRELVVEEAARLGVSAADLRPYDEHAAGIAQRLMSGGLYHRYMETMGPVMHDLAGRGPALIVGRGGNRLLADAPAAFHVRLVATEEFRLRRVMQYHWLKETPARAFMTEHNESRRRFSRDCFGGNWADPLEYHLVLNTGRLENASVDLAAALARRHWQHAGGSS